MIYRLKFRERGEEEKGVAWTGHLLCARNWANTLHFPYQLVPTFGGLLLSILQIETEAQKK